MPEIQPNPNSKFLDKQWCEECARIGSVDCIDHGGRLSEEAKVLGKRLGRDTYNDFIGGVWDMGPMKPQTKRPNAATSKLFEFDRLPAPKLIVTPSRPAPSNVANPPPAPKLASQSGLESSGFANLSPTKLAIKPTPSVPTLIKPTASVPLSAPTVPPPNTEAVALPNDPSTPSDLAREQGSADVDNDENSCKEGGVRFRENLGKYVVEYRPPRFKWKLWMGTYATVEEGRRACDCARFYAGQDKGGFYFKDSPTLFGDLGPLNRPFNLVSKDVKDKAFNVELKKRAKQVIRKVLDAQRSKQSIDVTRPTVKKPWPEAIVMSLQNLGSRNGRSNSSSSQENVPVESSPSSAVVDSGHEENESSQCAHQEVASTVQAGDSLTNLDAFENLGPLSDSSTLYSDFSSSAFIPGFNMMHSEHPDLHGCIQGSLDYEDDFDYDIMKLWTHDERP